MLEIGLKRPPLCDILLMQQDKGEGNFLSDVKNSPKPTLKNDMKIWEYVMFYLQNAGEREVLC